jgi:hypothetical protein
VLKQLFESLYVKLNAAHSVTFCFALQQKQQQQQNSVTRNYSSLNLFVKTPPCSLAASKPSPGSTVSQEAVYNVYETYVR